MKAHKEKLRVIISTAHHRIRGEVHLYENSRLTDILNADTATKDFLPVTNAQIHDMRNGTDMDVSFLSINRNHIEVVMEDDEAMALVRAKELISKRKFPEALELAQRAVKASPKDSEAFYIWGFCLAKGNDNKAARAAFEQCLKLAKDAETIQKAEEMLKTLPS